MLISIITPAYNEEKYIGAAIESVQNYCGANQIEHIIVDDQSIDATFSVASSYVAPSSDALQVLRNPKKGKINALNLALEHSRGDVIVLLGGDDLLCSDKLDLRVTPLLGAAGPAITRAAVRSFFHEPSNLGKRAPVHGGGNKSGCAVAMNREFAEIYMPVPATLPNEDTWLDVVAIGSKCTILEVDAIAAMLRIHPGNSWNRNARFPEYDRAIAVRNEAYSLGIEFFSSGDQDALAKLREYWKAEKLRRNRQILKLLFCTSISMRDRRHFVFSGHPLLYGIKRMINNIGSSSKDE